MNDTGLSSVSSDTPIYLVNKDCTCRNVKHLYVSHSGFFDVSIASFDFQAKLPYDRQRI